DGCTMTDERRGSEFGLPAIAASLSMIIAAPPDVFSLTVPWSPRPPRRTCWFAPSICSKTPKIRSDAPIALAIGSGFARQYVWGWGMEEAALATPRDD